MNIRLMYQWVADRSAEASQEWFVKQCQNPFASLYLYHKIGRLTVAEHCPEGFELSTGKRLGPGGSREQIAAQIEEAARKLPILPDSITE